MKGKIAFEEHMAIAETVAETRAFAGDSGRWDDFTDDILDLDDKRLAYMDQAGIELAILSLNAPAVQSILDVDEAIAVAKKANDAMANAVKRHPGRYLALAALPMQGPKAAGDELGRCVNELGFKGAQAVIPVVVPIPDQDWVSELRKYSSQGDVSDQERTRQAVEQMSLLRQDKIYEQVVRNLKDAYADDPQFLELLDEITRATLQGRAGVDSCRDAPAFPGEWEGFTRLNDEGSRRLRKTAASICRRRLGFSRFQLAPTVSLLA